MLPNFLVGLMVGAGAGAWVYSKTMRQTGGNTKSALTTAGIVAVITFLVIGFILSSFIS
jgi:hypothetical protein